MDWMTAVTLAIAVLGAVLGVINTVWALWRDRVRLRVAVVWAAERTPGVPEDGRIVCDYAHGLRDRPVGRLGIRVINVGVVPVTVSAVGTTCDGRVARRRGETRSRVFLKSPDTEVVHVGARLEARETVIVWGLDGTPAEYAVRAGVTRVFVDTECGVTVYGTSGLLKRLAQLAGQAQ